MGCKRAQEREYGHPKRHLQAQRKPDDLSVQGGERTGCCVHCVLCVWGVVCMGCCVYCVLCVWGVGCMGCWVRCVLCVGSGVLG